MATINADILKSKFGFNDPNVIQGILSDPGQVARYEREYAGSTGGSTSGGGGDLASLAAQTLKLQQEATRPAVESLQAGIPELRTNISTRQGQLSAQKTPLEQKYDQLLNSLVGQQSTATSREFGRRGIPLSSGLFDTTLLEQTQPTRERVGTEKLSALQELENAITNLGLTGVSQERDILNTIAQLQAGGGSNAITQAMSLLEQQQQQRQFESSQALKQLELNKPADLSTEIVTVGGRKKLINKQTGAVISDLGSSSGGTGSGLDPFVKNLLSNMFPQSIPTPNTSSASTGAYPIASLPGGRTKYSDGSIRSPLFSFIK